MNADETPDERHDLNLLAGLLDGRLEPDERRLAEKHLLECADCRRTLATWSAAAETRATGRAPWATWLAAAAVLAMAGWLGYRVTSTQIPAPILLPAPTAGPRGGSVPAAPSTESVPSAQASPAAAAPAPHESLDARRGGTKRIGDKTFRLEAGAWIDRAYDPVEGLPVVEVHGPGQARDLLARVPALAPYARIGDRVTVVLDGKVYRFTPPAP